MTAIPDGTTIVIVNPNSGRGRVRSLLGNIERLLPTLVDRYHIELTRGPGDGLRLAREAAVAGAPNVVAVGGDGTLHEVVNGLVTSNVKVPAVVLMPAGRGSDFARGLGIPLAVDRALSALRSQPVPLDVGRVTLPDGVRYFINVADVGLGAQVVSIANRWALPVPGSVSYFLATSRALFSDTGFPMKLEWEGDVPGRAEGRFTVVAAGNGSFFGGGMHICPGATPTDGLMEVVALRDVGFFRTFGLGFALYRGRIKEQPSVISVRCRKLTITSPDPLLVNLDGEETTHVPATIEIMPGVVPFKLPQP